MQKAGAGEESDDLDKWVQILEQILRLVSNSQCRLEKMKSAMEEASVSFEEQRCVFLKELELDFYEGNKR